jgi:hypothetical protein
MKKVIIASVAVAVLTLACGEEEGVTGEDDRILPTNPVNVLKCVEISFNRRGMGIIDGVVDGSFFFFFDPEDVGRTPPGSEYIIPGGWTSTGFRRAVKNMFDQAYSIDLAIKTSQVGTPSEEARHYRADNVTISLLVMVDELNGYIADQGYCNFEFVKCRGKTEPKLWRLTYWHDRTASGDDSKTNLKPASFGMILAMYY